MSNVQPQQEPSMEEILASIRRIISDEPGAASVAPKDEETVLDLTPEMQVGGGGTLSATPDEPDNSPPLASSPPPASMEALMASFEPAAVPEPSPVVPPMPRESVAAFAPAPEPGYTPEPLAAPAATVQIDERLISAQTEAAAAAALSGLSALGQHRFETGTVEALVRELLKPMLKEWLDANLPTIIERMVEGEIERLSRRAKSVN